MVRVVVTGGRGFIGRNLMVALGRRDDVDAVGFDVEDDPGALWAAAVRADVVFHLAGVNRPRHPDDFRSGNVDFTAELCRRLRMAGATPVVVFSSSIQASGGSAYGVSKRSAEELLERWSGEGGGAVAIFRLPNVFGKWGSPEYNSVVATFCHNVARGLPIRIDDPDAPLTLTHVDDVVTALVAALDTPPCGAERRTVDAVIETTVGELAQLVETYGRYQHSTDLPDFSSHFSRALFSTYMSYLPDEDLAFPLLARSDERGELAELLREPHAGQVFVSRTRPGVVRGNHYHDAKVERFMVIEGEGIVKLRALGDRAVREFLVSGSQPHAVIIPPGTAHSIENVGRADMITLFWANEVFDASRPDTYFEPVEPSEGGQ